MALSLVYSYVSLKSIFFLFILILFIIGLIDYTLINERNGCEMTFMFQFPQFVLIAIRNQISLKYPNYNLYAYGEGQYAQNIRNGDLSGAPVLFVPGNGGSYKQVRSLGSVALRMSDRYSRFHLNYFTVDFNEEYSGINSFQLQSQTSFLKECIIKIIDLYDKKGRDVSLVLIGHSIGGLIIRSALTLPQLEPYLNRIAVIITLATPHKSPVVPIDSKMTSFYRKVYEFWNLNRNQNLSHINVISIGGGFSDKLVRSDLTRLDKPYINDLSLVTNAIDDVWVSTDHLCIVWCKQLVLKITRLLFDLIDEKTLKIVENSERNNIIRYHLMQRTLGKSYPKLFIPEYYTSLTSNGDWSENFERIIKISKPKVLKPIYILLPLMRRESIVIRFEGLYRHEWVMACSATKQNNITFCDKGLNLHQYVKRMPSKPNDFERRVFECVSNIFLNKGFTHLLLAISPSVEPIDISIDRFTTAIRSKTILMPTLVQSLTMIFSPVVVLNIGISEETTFYKLSLIGLNQIWNTYWLRFDTISCYPSASNVGFLYLTIPWNKEILHSFVYPKRGQSSQMTLKVNSPKPIGFEDTKEPTLYLLIDPNCSYKLHLKPSISEMMGQILRHYGVIILPIIVSILLSLLSIQIIPKPLENNLSINSPENQFFIKNKNHFYDLSINISKNLRSVSIYGLLVLSSASSAIYSNYTERHSLTSSLTFPQLLTLYLFFYLIAHSLTYFFLLIISLIFIILSSVLNYLENKFISSHSDRNSGKHEKEFKFKIMPILVLIIMAFIGSTYISTLTFLISLFAHNIQMICLSKKCKRIENRLGVDSYSSLWNLHLTLLALLYFSTIPTIPLLLDWINLKMPVLSFGLSDPYLIPALFLTLSCPIIWHQYSPVNINISERKRLSLTLKIIAILSSICCQINYWNISLIISVSLLIVSSQQLTEWFRSRNLKCD